MKFYSELQRGQLVHLGLVGFVTFWKPNLRTGQVSFSKTAKFFCKLFPETRLMGSLSQLLKNLKTRGCLMMGNFLKTKKNQSLFDFQFFPTQKKKKKKNPELGSYFLKSNNHPIRGLLFFNFTMQPQWQPFPRERANFGYYKLSQRGH